jgi:LytS/YehU family sensor histidine kinase
MNESVHRPPESFARPPRERPQNPRPLPPPKRLPPYLIFVIISTLIIGFDTGLKLSVLWVRSEQKRVTTEKENMEIQLAFLRNQISPHFFMNTLNNIHALIDIDTEDAKASVIKLSKLMRYLLYDSDHEKVPLSKEIEFIRSYVELMQLRYSDKVLINLSFPETIPGVDISPMLFTSIVENAFKYGVSYQHESVIDILMNADAHDLYFRIRNSVHPSESKHNESGGIGLVNLQKRLHLIYGKNHSITTSQNNDIFEINIKIPLYDN